MKKMRFFILLLGLVSLFGFTKVLKAEDAEGSVTISTISITKMLDGEQQGTPVVETGVVGDTLEYIPTIENATFMFWVVNGAVRADLPKDLTIRVTSKLELVAHFASSDNYSVAFLDTNTKLLGVNFVNTEDPLTIPSEPSRVGTNFLGWAPMSNYDEEAVPSETLENPGSKTYFVAKYEVADRTERTITINTVESKHILNDVVTATTTDAEDFSYWMDQDSGAILSYSPTYKFSVLDKDVNLVSVHEGAKTDPMVSIRRFFNFKTGYDSFIGHYELDENLYELIEVGFVHDEYSDNPHITRSINQQTNEFMLTTPDETVENNHYMMRAYMKYVEKGKENAPVQTVRNKSSYEVVFEVNPPSNNPVNTNEVFLVGYDNNWDTEQSLTLLKDASNDKYYYTFKMIEEPGYVFSHDYKYLYKKTSDFEYEESLVGNRNIEILLGDVRQITQSDTINPWKTLDIVVKLTSVPNTTGSYPIKLIGSMGSWNQANALEFNLVDDAYQVTLKLVTAELNEFKLYLDKGQEKWYDHQASSDMYEEWGNYVVNEEHFINGVISIDIPFWKGLS